MKKWTSLHRLMSHWGFRIAAVTHFGLLTGRRDKKPVERGIQSGADDYGIKPIDPDLFMARVEMLLAKKGSADVSCEPSARSFRCECSLLELAKNFCSLCAFGSAESLWRAPNLF